MSKSFTPKQIANWRAYEKVRRTARHNMLSPNAMIACGLDSREHFFCIDHYDELKEEADRLNKDVPDELL